MLSAPQKSTIQAIVNVFETGRVRGDYGSVTLIQGDTGKLTYGRSQTTLMSGNLFKLVDRYCRAEGSDTGNQLRPYLEPLRGLDDRLDGDVFFQNLLRAAADDPVMRDVQDAFFDDAYWQPAADAADKHGITTALGVGTVYDGFVHGNWALIRSRTDQAIGTPAEAGEQAWVSAYVAKRREWLAGSSRPDLRQTVYRMDTFRGLIDHGLWDLQLPLVVRTLEVSEASLAAPPPNVYDGPAPRSRAIAVSAPLMRGRDVRLVQVLLTGPRFGERLVADAVFGQATAVAVQRLQTRLALPVTGRVDGPVFDALGI